MKQTLNFLLVGVGGQGTILASDVLSQVGFAAGYQVKRAEVHGLSQRGGSVTSHVRWAEKVASPLAGEGEVNVLLAFEKLEALRFLGAVRHNALVVVNLEAIVPIAVSSLGQHYPDDARLRAAIADVTPHAAFVDGPEIARSLGDPRVTNTILLGTLSRMLEVQALTGTELTETIWLDVLAARVPPASIAINTHAFQLGRSVACGLA